jgi:hypothetical protein
MTFEEYIDKKFEENLKLAREEIKMHDPSDDIECRAWNTAVEWTQEEINSDVILVIGRKYWKQQEAINKAFFE